MIRYVAPTIIISVVFLLQQDYVRANANSSVTNEDIVKVIENVLENKFKVMMNMLSTGNENFLLHTQDKMEALEQKCSRCLNTTDIQHQQTLTKLANIKETMVWEIRSLKDKIESFGNMISGCEHSREKKINDTSDEQSQTVNNGNAEITQVIPSNIQRGDPSKISLIINNLPSGEGNLFCLFNAQGKTLTTKANRTAQGVTCLTPMTTFLPYFPHGEYALVTNLSVSAHEGGRGHPVLATTLFSFYDCDKYQSCTECVSSPFPCDWCVDGHICTHDTAGLMWTEMCRNDKVVFNGLSVNQDVSSIRSGPSFCPRITPIYSPEILMPAVSNYSIKVKIQNALPLITNSSMVCQFNINGRVSSYNANLRNNIIACEPLGDIWGISTAVPITNATFDVIWGQSNSLDNPDNIHVVLYQCSSMADNCGSCLVLPKRFGCGWCLMTGKCEVQCPSSPSGTLSSRPDSWLSRNDTCPNN